MPIVDDELGIQASSQAIDLTVTPHTYQTRAVQRDGEWQPELGVIGADGEVLWKPVGVPKESQAHAVATARMFAAARRGRVKRGDGTW